MTVVSKSDGSVETPAAVVGGESDDVDGTAAVRAIAVVVANDDGLLAVVGNGLSEVGLDETTASAVGTLEVETEGFAEDDGPMTVVIDGGGGAAVDGTAVRIVEGDPVAEGTGYGAVVGGGAKVAGVAGTCEVGPCVIVGAKVEGRAVVGAKVEGRAVVGPKVEGRAVVGAKVEGRAVAGGDAVEGRNEEGATVGGLPEVVGASVVGLFVEGAAEVTDEFE